MVKFTIPNFKPTHTLNDFEFLHDPRDDNLKLGAGSLAAVRLAQEKNSGKLVALKTVELNNITETDLHNLKSEILIHKDLDHPNIIKFHGYIQHGDLVYIILDYATNGNLYNYLQCKKKLTDKEVFRFFHQACLATNYLHQKDILHRDIKPENILLDQDFNIKLCDFGWSVRNINQKRSTFCGTYEYMAPEIIREQTYDYRVDIWAIGVLLFELIHNKPPYKGRSLPEIKSSLSKDKITFKQGIQQDLKRLIQKILDHNPEKRIGFDLILSCSWVNEHLEREINFRRSVYQGDIIGRGSRFGNVSSKLKIFDDSAETQPSKPDTNNSLPQEIQSPQIEPNEPAKDLDRFSTRKRISTVASLYSVPTDLNSNHNTNRSKQSSSLASVLNQEKPVEGVSHRKRIFDENFLSPTFSYRLDHVFEKLKQPKEYERKFTESSVLKANQNQTMRNLTEFDPENSYQNSRFETKKFNQSLLSSQTSGLASPAVSPRTGIFQGSNSLIQSESNKVVTFEKFKNLSFVKDVRSFFDKVSIPSCRKPQI